MTSSKTSTMLAGLYTAIITPFKDNLEVDYQGLVKNLEFQLQSNVDGIVALGTTAETACLSKQEKLEILKLTVEVCRSRSERNESEKRVPVIAGVSSNCTETTIDNAQKAEDFGADILLVASPYYNKPSQDGLFQHFKHVSEATSLPIMLYNIPGRSAVNIETSTLEKILDHCPSVLSIKEASGSMTQVMKSLELLNQKPEVTLLSGDDALTLPMMSLGASGVVSVISNLFPKELKELCQLCHQGDLDKARTLHFKLLGLIQAAFIETSPMPIKEMMNIRGLPAGPCRLPLTKVSSTNKKIISDLLNNF